MITSVVNLIYYLVLRLIFKTTFKIKILCFLHLELTFTSLHALAVCHLIRMFVRMPTTFMVTKTMAVLATCAFTEK